MNSTIRLYNPSEDYKKLLDLIRSEGEEWADYLQPGYREALEKSVTYVAYTDEELCGYARSHSDFGLFVWVVDLLVHQDFRGHEIGRMLLERVKADHSNQDVFIMSDVDPYYEKLGYSKEGSIFKIC